MSVSLVRLAAAGDPGADIYNAYHVLTQMAGLYAQAAASDGRVEGRAVWGELADQAIEDLGELYGIWSIVARRAPAPAATPDLRLHGDLRATCERLGVMVRLLNLWVPIQRWARLLLLVERKWTRLAMRLTPEAGEESARLGRLRERAAARAQRVLGLYEIYTSERRRLDATFDASVTLLANGGLAV